jgi:hypothetical protein
MSVHEQYRAGMKFRVIKEGCELSGWKSGGPSWFSGWRQVLHIGDVIEVQSVGAGFGSDPGYGVHFKADAIYAEFHPSTGGMWAYQPAPGYLEPLE